jgi:hypothetical protein
VEERRLRVALRRSNERLREYADEVAALSTAAEAQPPRPRHPRRPRPPLTEAAILLEQASAMRDSDPVAADTALVEAHRAVRQALDDVRRSVRSLPPRRAAVSPERRRGRPRRAGRGRRASPSTSAATRTATRSPR